MDPRSQTAIVAAVLSTAISIAVLLRPRKQRVHWLFGSFGLAVAAWYTSSSLLTMLGPESFWWRALNLGFAIMVPIAALHFFRAFAHPQNSQGSWSTRLSHLVGLGLFGLVVSPYQEHRLVSLGIFLYVFCVLVAALGLLALAARNVQSRFERDRLRYLTFTGAVAATFTLGEYLTYVGLDLPPVGTFLTLLFLYILSQSILSRRILDMYELAGRLSVLTALSFLLAGIFWALRRSMGSDFFIQAVVAALVVLLISEPIRGKVEAQISQVFFRERYELEQTLHSLRKRLAHVLKVEMIGDLVLGGLEESRRVTHGALYLVDTDMRGYRLMGSLGPAPPRRLEFAPLRPLLDRLEEDRIVVLEGLERDLEEHQERGEAHHAETLHEVLQILEAMHCSVCLPIRGEKEVVGLLCVRDARLRDAFGPEDLQLLEGLCAQVATAVENSRLYRRLEERDRLAAMGEMSAGLAHEIRNPLGAIKGSAQYLTETDPASHPQQREFLDIIVEEADRLDRVVSSFLEYANPAHGDPDEIDVNAVIERTVQVLATDVGHLALSQMLHLEDDLPEVRIDPERLRQVLINLIQNALQVVEGRGDVHISSERRTTTHPGTESQNWVAIHVADTGPGVPEHILANIFVPFVTTRARGTGLGLAISQRIVASAGGRIDVHTSAGVGSTFTVLLPAAPPRTPPKDGAGPETQSSSGAFSTEGPEGASEIASVTGKNL